MGWRGQHYRDAEEERARRRIPFRRRYDWRLVFLQGALILGLGVFELWAWGWLT